MLGFIIILKKLHFLHIFDFSIKQNTKTILIDPMSEEIDYTYSKGMLGQLYFINELLNIIKE